MSGSLLCSVILPTKDRLSWVGSAIASVKEQTYTNWELIILDNSIEPYSNSKLVGTWTRFPQIHYEWQSCNGVADASTKALELAEGDIIIPLGDDDRLAPTALERAVEAFTQWPTLQWMYGVTELRNPDGTVITHRGHIPFSLPELRKWYYLGGAVYWRKSLTDRLGGYDQRYDGAADYDLYLKFAEDSVPYWCPEVLYLYTDWAGTDSRVRPENQARLTQEIASR